MRLQALFEEAIEYGARNLRRPELSLKRKGETMNDQEYELRDALIAPINRARRTWKRAKAIIPVPSPEPPPKAGLPLARAMLRAKAIDKEKLPRGIRRRGRSLEVYLTFPDGHAERRSLSNLSVKMAVQQREIWRREIAE